MRKNDGGPAFPGEYWDAITPKSAVRGMSLRDWLAGQALASLDFKSIGHHSVVSEAVARFAYAVADAMLKEKDK